ncbi:MAG TPA: hypothetical protein VJQ56_02765 [Blastocatellia bacterium]|nr:hypothetical protein [Blastocatellia bacterium]
MKRLFTVCLLILCLSFPVLAGHTLGGMAWCDCNDPTSHDQGLVLQDDEPQHETPVVDVEPGVLLAFTLLVLMIRAKN